MAVQENHMSMLDTLLERGVIIDAVGKYGWSAFHIACYYGKPDCAEALAKAGCDMTLQNIDGNMGLQLAQQNGHRSVAAMLLRRIVAEKTEANGTQNEKLTPEVLDYSAAGW